MKPPIRYNDVGSIQNRRGCVKHHDGSERKRVCFHRLRSQNLETGPRVDRRLGTRSSLRTSTSHEARPRHETTQGSRSSNKHAVWQRNSKQTRTHRLVLLKLLRARGPGKAAHHTPRWFHCLRTSVSAYIMIMTVEQMLKQPNAIPHTPVKCCRLFQPPAIEDSIRPS